ncbi:neurofilament medium polypeptide-like [Mercenaria mercenaria]|uniref:neurofilament medium polypeptide-like n=1 Tax=Mercenaria mercenaria TaxID=6596 RepID=UPI00234EDD02|nr:neurofilament medium polypeptide-like [Mercenaria mercenaria]XP_053394673.1 neurofilament medium polypeptide-like [Mercenaria mercenaria]XP_053394674.1 neurofilament medium polypeptide-like [Mercenaria mercenaria]XP_053394675.1 neurofilament medium polypeptide-like [Mercenaria mercenaria]
MKPPVLDSASVAMATKCSSGVTMMTDDMVHMRSHRSHRRAHANHRKSAVELLEASKGTYVKSTTVLNHRQELKHPENLSVGNRDVLSLPITAGKHSPSDEPSSLSKENARNFNTLGERDNSRSPPTFHKENLQQTSSGSSSPLTGKKLSVISSVSSSVSQSSNSPSVGKKSSLTSQSSKSPSVGNKASGTSRTSEVKINFAVTSSETEHSASQGKKLSLTSVTSSVSHASTKSHSKDEVDSSGFKTPLTPPPVPGHKPVVPPKPGSATKPTTPPKPGPKPVIQQTPDKPVPPPRPARKFTKSITAQSENTTDTSAKTMASSDKKPTPNIKNQASDSSEQKRFSSVSASACDTPSKDQNEKSVQSRHSLHSHTEGFLKPLSATTLSASVGVLVERHRSPLPKPRIDKQLNEIELPPRRQLHRSQSDLSNCRHSRTSSDFSDLSSRLSRNSTEVERFFNEMGLDRSVLEPMRKLSETRQKDILDSLSSFDSLEAHSLSSRLSNDLERLPMESEQDLSGRDAGSTSVVERNARIIKWLCSVKKARTVLTKPVKKKSEAS